ncbi:unnamed protein product [Malus baccata var. baccata]
MSGEHVAHLSTQLSVDFPKQGALSLGSKKHSTKFDGVDYKRVLKHGYYFGRRMFTRLIAALHTSLIDVLVYIYLPDMYYENEKLLSHIQHLRLGMLSAWEVGGCDIGHQMVYSNISGSHNSIIPSMTNDRSSFLDACGSNVLRNQELEETYYFETKPHLICKIFLLPHRFSEVDSICFSPLRITRLVKNRNMMNPKVLHAEFVDCDDNF